MKGAIHIIRGSVQKQAGFDIYKIDPYKTVDKAFIPALFLAGKVSTLSIILFPHFRNSQLSTVMIFGVYFVMFSGVLSGDFY